jgi:hypothetical protein
MYAEKTAPNYKNFQPFVITLRIFLYVDRTLGENGSEGNNLTRITFGAIKMRPVI